ncbi:recombinase family protein [Demequina salsinemoris]|uniref:recombinase family protein n=1 Tax=Demequina salsinemoris TaxID=577470 RepID=UPI0007821AFB|nr:recombinase family protein [Demequina salsinemoris]
MDDDTSEHLESAPLPAAIYCRISRDKAGGGLGVQRQEEDCTALASRLGWQVVATYVDNDISAYSGAPRPQYREMLDAVRSGQVQGVIAWHTDRLHRRALELEEFVALAEAHDLQIQTVTAGTLDLSSASGRMVARMLGAAAQHEVDHARERMKRAKAQRAAEGKPGGGPRPFGYEKDGLTVRESEAQVVRDATTAVLAGRSLRAVAAELNEQGHTTSTGKAWTYARIKDVLTRPRNAGLSAHGRADRGTLNIVGKAQWPAIVDEDTWRACYDLLADPGRRKQQNTATRWLGSGHYTCGLCGSKLRVTAMGATPSRKNQERKYHYRCQDYAHLTIAQAPTDDYVRGVVADLVRDERIAKALAPKDIRSAEDVEKSRALRVRLEQFERDYMDGKIPAALWEKSSARVNAELAEVERRLSIASQKAVALPILSQIDPGQAFLDAPLDVQRAVVQAVVQVEVGRSPTGGRSWTQDRIRISPATDLDRRST